MSRFHKIQQKWMIVENKLQVKENIKQANQVIRGPLPKVIPLETREQEDSESTLEEAKIIQTYHHQVRETCRSLGKATELES